MIGMCLTLTTGMIKKAIAMAEERGEIYRFKTEEEAIDFAEGSWKESSIEDIEGDKFFKDKGLDYMEIMGAERRYQEVNDELEFEKQQASLGKQAEWNMSKNRWESTYKPSQEVIKQNPQIYLPNGDIRSDVSERVTKLQKESDELQKIVVGNKKNVSAIEEFNRYLQRESGEAGKNGCQT